MKEVGVGTMKIQKDAGVLFAINREDISYADDIVLKNISLSIKEGDKVAIIGQSGAGKTTLLRRLFHLKPGQSPLFISIMSWYHN